MLVESSNFPDVPFDKLVTGNPSNPKIDKKWLYSSNYQNLLKVMIFY